jgi:6-hydroxy-3-succinoylpyridine 3-monooxygenase
MQAWKVEEKQTDVNLALQIYHDAISGDVDHVIVVTNDTDIQPSLKMIRTHTSVKIGLVIPTIDDERPASTGLTKLAHWVRKPTLQELAECQLPRVIQGKKRATTKPMSWYRDPVQLQKIIDLALIVLKKKSAVFKWLETPNPYLNNQKPIELLDASDQGAKEVIAYIENYKQ